MDLKKKLQTCNFIIFRYSSVQASPLIKIASDLIERTVYCTPALREYAPEKTDCLTAIHYIFKQALSIDMPRQLLSLEDWNSVYEK